MIKRIIAALFFLTVLMVGLVFVSSHANISPTEYYVKKIYKVPNGEDLISKDTFTILTYNIGYMSGMTNNLAVFRPKELFLQNLQDSKVLLEVTMPDLIAFQEIDFDSKRSYRINQLDNLAYGGGYTFAYQSVNWDKKYVPFPYWPPSQHFGEILSGQAILSKYPIGKAKTFVLEKPLNKSFIYKTYYLDRLLQIADVDFAGTQVKVMNVHLEAFDEDTRISQAKFLKPLIEKYVNSMPVILLGDLNSLPLTSKNSNGVIKILASLGQITSAVTDQMYLSNPEEYYTFDTKTPYQMIDYIFYNPKFIEKIEARVVHEAGNISDHLPVMMKFRLKK